MGSVNQSGFFNRIKDDHSTNNYYGMSNKKLKSFCESVVSQIGDQFKEIIFDEKKLMSIIESNVIERVYGNIQKGQVRTEKELKEHIENTCSVLNNDLQAFKTDIEQQINTNRDQLDRYLAQIVKNATNTYISFNISFENIIRKIDEAFDKSFELQKGFLCIQDADFENAFLYLNKAADDNKLKAKAYFGLALARNRIQLIYDVETQQYIPICYNYDAKPDFEDAIYCAKCANNQELAEKFEEFKKEIKKKQKEFSVFSEGSNLDYDCFICTKVKDENGETDDCKWVNDNYDALKKLLGNKRLFYSEEDCKNYKRGSLKYNALISYALSRAKCMLLVCSKKEYLDTPWVKNEYTRFRRSFGEGNNGDRRIIIVYKKDVVKLLNRNGFQDEDRAGASDDFLKHLANRIKTIVEDEKGYISDNFKYCPQCDKRLHLGASTCTCGTTLLSAQEYMNNQLEKSKTEAEIARKKAEQELQKAKEAQEEVKKLKDVVSKKGELTKDEEYIRGKDTDPQQIKYLRECANIGDAQAQSDLADYYLNTDKDQSEFWLKKSADGNHSGAKYKLGHILVFYGELNEDKEKGKCYLEELADSSSTENSLRVKAKYSLAQYYTGNLPRKYGNFIEFSDDYYTKDKRTISIFEELSQPVFQEINNGKKFVAETDEEKISLNSYYMYGLSKSRVGNTRSIRKDGKKIIKKAAKSGVQEARERWYNESWFALMLISLVISVLALSVAVFSGLFSQSLTIVTVSGMMNNGLLIFCWVFAILCLSGCLICVIAKIIMHLKYKVRFCLDCKIFVPILIIFIVLLSSAAIYFMDTAEIRTSIYNYEVNEDGTLTIELDYSFKNIKKLKIPSEIDGYEVSAIGSFAFNGCSSLESIEIPSSVTSIGSSAFRDCSSLTSIEIPSSVTSIGSSAFRDCSSLTIYCEAESKPSGWTSSWNSSNVPVVWNYKNN